MQNEMDPYTHRVFVPVSREKGPPGVKGGFQAQEDTLTHTCHQNPCVAQRCCSPFCRQPHPMEAHLRPTPLSAQSSITSNPGTNSQNPLGRSSFTEGWPLVPVWPDQPALGAGGH